MDEPILTMEEREAINNGRWFSNLSPSLRHDILRCAYVKRFKDGDLIVARGEPPTEWTAVAKGAVRVSSTSLSGKQITLTYVEPGVWFGDVAMFDGDQRTHDAYAHGPTTLLCVARTDFQKILATHVELWEALMRLQARRIRTLFGLVEASQVPVIAIDGPSGSGKGTVAQRVAKGQLAIGEPFVGSVRAAGGGPIPARCAALRRRAAASPAAMYANTRPGPSVMPGAG